MAEWTVSDFWKEKVDELNEIKEKKEKEKGKNEKCEEKGMRDEASYEVVKIEDHERIEGIFFYKVKWKEEDEKSWVSECQFESDTKITSYWRNFYFGLKNK